MAETKALAPGSTSVTPPRSRIFFQKPTKLLEMVVCPVQKLFRVTLKELSAALEKEYIILCQYVVDGHFVINFFPLLSNPIIIIHNYSTSTRWI